MFFLLVMKDMLSTGELLGSRNMWNFSIKIMLYAKETHQI
jgi:hypothetical protein